MLLLAGGLFYHKLKAHCITQCAFFLHIKSRIHEVNIFLVQFFTQQLNCLTETLEVNNFPGTQELNDVIHIRVVADSQNIIVGSASLLLCGQIFRQISNWITLYGNRRSFYKAGDPL